MRLAFLIALCSALAGAQEIAWNSAGSGLADALRTPEGAAQVQSTFDDAFSRAAIFVPGVPVTRIPGDPPGSGPITRAVVVPIVCGSYSLAAGRLILSRRREPRVEILRELAAVAGDADAARRLYDARRADVEAADALSQHILRHALDSLPTFSGPDAERRRLLVLGRNVLSVIENAAQTREASAWHIHPPDWTPSGWADQEPAAVIDGSAEPTDADRSDASASGRGLVLIFHADGFDAVDLSPGGERVVYRSPAWRAHFDAVHARLSR